MKKCWIVLALALTLFMACCNREKVRKPEVFLSEQQMIDVLTDAYLIEAELNHKKSVGEDVSSLQIPYYDQLFEHYGINDSIFEANMNYYSHELPALERIMDSVNMRFVKAQ